MPSSLASSLNPDVPNSGEIFNSLYANFSPTLLGSSPNICLYQNTLLALIVSTKGQLRVTHSPDFTERNDGLEKSTARAGAKTEILCQ